MMDKFNRVGNVWIDKLDSEVDSGNQICLMDYFNRAALASIVTVSTELPLTQKIPLKTIVQDKFIYLTAL